ncbi:sensor histidine kinase [Plantactinospora sp. WMMB782]|uniref:sensor histidine kinase n=1 Tax=Plantactinospora sp. WMMB782 TaxID=3404121 RepID=UPI003B94D4F1
MTGSALDRLRRLPRWIAAWLCLITTVVSVVFGILLVRADGHARELEMDGDLRRVAAGVSRLVQYDGTVVTRYVSEDELNTRCPQFAILPGATERFTGHFSQLECVPMRRERLERLAVEAVRSGHQLTGYLAGGDGARWRVYVEPFRRDNGQFVGAVVVVADAGPALAARDRLIQLVIGGGLLLVLAAGAAGYLISLRALRPAATALEQQEALLADTAHDLRTPVAALRALAETVVRDPTQRTDLLSRAVDLAQRMGDIIDGVLMRARLAAGVEQLDIQPIWLDQLVSAVVEQTPVQGARVTVTTTPTRVDADPGLVRRAIANLLDNAVRHGRQPGSEATVHITVAGGRIIVADHGPGIDPALAREQFDRFTSGGGSSGLGLAIVRWVAQAHNGTLRVYNAEDGGAIFELSLPYAE